MVTVKPNTWLSLEVVKRGILLGAKWRFLVKTKWLGMEKLRNPADLCPKHPDFPRVLLDLVEVRS